MARTSPDRIEIRLTLPKHVGFPGLNPHGFSFVGVTAALDVLETSESPTGAVLARLVTTDPAALEALISDPRPVAILYEAGAGSAAIAIDSTSILRPTRVPTPAWLFSGLAILLLCAGLRLRLGSP